MVVTEKQIELIISIIETCGKTYDVIASGSGVSKSTISRLVKTHQATAYVIDMLSAYFEVGEEMVELGGGEAKRSSCPLVSGVSGELKRLEGVYAEREAHTEAQCAERVAAIKVQMEMLQAHHEQALKRRDETFDRSVAYLKTQVEEMRKERKELQAELDAQRKRAVAAEESVRDMDRKRHNIFWIMGIICACLSVGLSIALFSNSIV